MHKNLIVLAIAASALATPVLAAPHSTLIGPSGQLEAPLILHRLDGTHRVTFVGVCLVEFDAAYVQTGSEGLCEAGHMEVAGDIVARTMPAPYSTGVVVTRAASPLALDQ